MTTTRSETTHHMLHLTREQPYLPARGLSPDEHIAYVTVKAEQNMTRALRDPAATREECDTAYAIWDSCYRLLWSSLRRRAIHDPANRDEEWYSPIGEEVDRLLADVEDCLERGWIVETRTTTTATPAPATPWSAVAELLATL